MAAPFAKTIAPTTPIAADLGGPPATGVTATATKPMYSKKGSHSRSGRKPAGLTKTGSSSARFSGGKR